jgi:hypothetical protein
MTTRYYALQADISLISFEAQMENSPSRIQGTVASMTPSIRHAILMQTTTTGFMKVSISIARYSMILIPSNFAGSPIVVSFFRLVDECLY